MRKLALLVAGLMLVMAVGCGNKDGVGSGEQAEKNSKEFRDANAAMSKDQKLPPGDGPSN